MSDPAADERDPDPYKVIGTVVAKHRILRLIGEGRMGKVYEGEHVLLRRSPGAEILRALSGG